ncbi:MAG: hypothetical protein IOD15_07345 [Phycisphaerales bacterium]|nr:hypothetical protein [Phycisphaerales bacterium]
MPLPTPSPSVPVPDRGLPLHDWQFWAVTAIVGLACFLLLRAILAKARRGPAKRAATLTISAKPSSAPPPRPGPTPPNP